MEAARNSAVRPLSIQKKPIPGFSDVNVLEWCNIQSDIAHVYIYEHMCVYRTPREVSVM